MLVKKYRMIAWLGYMYVCSPSIVNPSVYAKFVFSCSRLASVSVQSINGRMDSKVHCDSHVHAKLHETFGFFIVSSSGKHVFTTQLRHDDIFLLFPWLPQVCISTAIRNGVWFCFCFKHFFSWKDISGVQDEVSILNLTMHTIGRPFDHLLLNMFVSPCWTPSHVLFMTYTNWGPAKHHPFDLNPTCVFRNCNMAQKRGAV